MEGAVPSILIVDDDTDTAATFSALLEAEGFRTSVAHSGVEALALLQNQRFDLLTVDLRLPDMSGLDIVRGGRTLGAVSPFVLVTAFGTLHDGLAAGALGAVDVVEKPIAAEEFIRRIAVAVGQSVSDPGCREAYATRRWAQATAKLASCPRDPKTLAIWSATIYSSPGAIRNWCRTAGIPARRSLVFMRLLRAISLQRPGRQFGELLDVVDRRTLDRLFLAAGFGHPKGRMPASVEDFIDRQTLIANGDALREIRIALHACSHIRHNLCLLAGFLFV